MSEQEKLDPRQKQIILTFLETHPDLLKTTYNETYSKRDSDLLWSELSDKLNKVPRAPEKDMEQWQRILLSEFQSRDVSSIMSVNDLLSDILDNTLMEKSDEEIPVTTGAKKEVPQSPTIVMKSKQPKEQSNVEKVLMKKLIKSDSIKLKYLKRKLKMEDQYHRRKLTLMRDLLRVKQLKVRVEEKQATALNRIARSLDRIIQIRHPTQH